MRRPHLRDLFRRGARKDSLRGIRRDVAIPFDMFDEVRTVEELRAASKLEGIYHKGHRRGWDGKVVLEELVARHGPIDLPPQTREAMRGVLGVILWGELAAWKVSAELALTLEPLEAKLAATSQTHDEARHFYTMVDYLELLGEVPKRLGPAATGVLERTLRAPSLAQRLLGMQLMVEPLALTVFQLVREKQVEPILTELLALYERDEARHVALGVLHLPRLIRGMTIDEALGFWAWQYREAWRELDLLKELLPDFEVLGIDPMRVIDLGRRKQVLAVRMMMDELGYDLPIHEPLLRIIGARLAWDHPSDKTADRWSRLQGAVEALFHRVDTSATRLTDVVA
jgi:hypothetical protein